MNIVLGGAAIYLAARVATLAIIPFTMCLQPNGIEVVRKFGRASFVRSCLVMRILSERGEGGGGGEGAQFRPLWLYFKSNCIGTRAREAFCQSPLRLVAWKGAKLQCINLMRVDVLILQINFKEPKEHTRLRTPSRLPLCKFYKSPRRNFSGCKNSRFKNLDSFPPLFFNFSLALATWRFFFLNDQRREDRKG